MNITFDDFIMIRPNALPVNVCQELMDHTKNNMEEITALTMDVDQGNAMQYEGRDPADSMSRRDFCFYISYSIYRHIRTTYYSVISTINEGLSQYVSKYPAIASLNPPLHVPDLKYHIVHSGGGYHNWHTEWNVVPPNDRRILVWHLALTSHENEGELEFLYFDKRIEAIAGQLIVWPASFPYIHRGNAIRSATEKHYLTGWYFVT